MRHLLEWFKESAGIWFVIAVLTFMFIAYGISGRLVFHSNQKINEAGHIMELLPYEKYEDTKLTGNEVLHAIKKYQKDLTVRIYNGESSVNYNGQFKAIFNSKKSERYIGEEDYYNGKLIKDKDGNLICLVFLKEGIELTKEEYEKILKGEEQKEDFTEIILRLKEQLNEIRKRFSNEKQKMDKLSEENGKNKNQQDNLTAQNEKLRILKESLNQQIKTEREQHEKVCKDYQTILDALKKQGILVEGSTEAIVSQIGQKSSGVNLKTGSIKKLTGSKNGVPNYIETGFEPCILMIESEALLTKFDIVKKNTYVRTAPSLGDCKNGGIYFRRNYADEWAADEVTADMIQVNWGKTGLHLSINSTLDYNVGYGCSVTYYIWGK